MGFWLLIIILAFVIFVVYSSIKVVRQGEGVVIERLGKYTKTVEGGITFLIPFIDRVRATVDTRERVVSFPPQAVITQDNLTVAIDTVVTFQINDPMRAIYGVDNYLTGVEQTTTATLRDVVGGMTLEETLTSREVINRRLRGELDAATTKWGLRISRVELKAIDPPPSIQQSMEKQMKADREKRAMILTAEGQREADIKTAEGEKQARILAAEGEKHAAILQAEAERQAEILRAQGDRAARFIRAQGEAKSIQKVNAAIKSAQITPDVLAYQYLEKLPEMAQGSANKMWVVPSQFGDALESFAKQFGEKGNDGVFRYEAPEVSEETLKLAETDTGDDWFSTESAPEIAAAVAEANAVANKAIDDPLSAALQSTPAAKPAPSGTPAPAPEPSGAQHRSPEDTAEPAEPRGQRAGSVDQPLDAPGGSLPPAFPGGPSFGGGPDQGSNPSFGTNFQNSQQPQGPGNPQDPRTDFNRPGIPPLPPQQQNPWQKQ